MFMFKGKGLFQRFAARMIAAFVIAILIPTLFTSASFYFVANNTVKHNVRESTVQIAKQAADSLSFILNVGSDMSDLIYGDLRIQSTVAHAEAAERDPVEWRENEEYLRGFLNNLVYSSSFVNIVYVLRDDHSSWGSGTFSRVKLSRYGLEEQPWTREARSLDGGLVWMGLQDDRLSGGGDNTELVLPVGRVLKDYTTMENIGYVLVNLNGRKIIDTLQQMKLGDTGSFFVVNPEGRIMVDPDVRRMNQIVDNPELLQHITEDDAIEFEFVKEETPHYGVKQRLSNGWLIVGTVPVHEITDRLDTLHRHILSSFGLFTLLGIAIGLFFANRVTRPIKLLTQRMKRVQHGDLTVRTDVDSTDEIGLMSRQFNRMIVDIDRLMRQVAEEQQMKQAAEIRAVIHRINPHFLFNTLSTLRWLIKYDQSDKAYEGISSLIRLLDANMGKKGTFIPIEEELDFNRKYLAILELRYNKSFRLNTQVDPEAAALLIPRMLIQPLIENAIFHGIVPSGNEGQIDVDVLKQGEQVLITVHDNGIGLLPDKQLIQQSIKEAAKAGQLGIGLRHVYESVALYFGPESEFRLFSPASGGTTAQIVLYPKDRWEGEAHAESLDRG